MTRALVAALAIMLLCAPVLPFTAASPAAAAPGGMATIPDSNVAADVPSGETIPLSASELQGGVLASEHADSLEVVLTTAERAPTVMGGDSAAVSGNGMALVLRDDQQSAGREVALDAGQLQEALGYKPQAIYGTHEDGSTWTASAEYVDGYLVFDVPHFSSNTVTFSGEVEINAQSATEGTEWTYSIGNNGSISDPNITVTGVESQETDYHSGSFNDGTLTITPAGNQPASGATVTVEGSSEITNPGSSSSFTHTTSFRYQVSEAGGGELSAYSRTDDKLFRDGATSGGTMATISYPETISDLAPRRGDGGAYVITGDSDTSSSGPNGLLVKFVTQSGVQASYTWTSALDSSDTTSGVIGTTENGEAIAIADHQPNSAGGWRIARVDSSGTAAWGQSFNGGTVAGGWVRDVAHIPDTDYSLVLADGATYTVDETDGSVIDTTTQTGGSTAETATAATNSNGESAALVWVDGEVYGLSIDSSGSITVEDSGANFPNGKARITAPGTGQSGFMIFAPRSTDTSNDGTYSKTYEVVDRYDWSGTSTLPSEGAGATIYNPTDTITHVGVNDGAVVAAKEPSSGSLDSVLIRDIATTEDPAIDVGDDGVTEWSVSGPFTGSKTLDIGSVSSDTPVRITANGAAASAEVQYTEHTVTDGAEVALNGGVISETAKLSPGESATFTGSATSISEDNTLSLTFTTSLSADAPPLKANIQYSHDTTDKIVTNYTASTFEESYNISRTYADATENAQATIPFASSRVVSVGGVEYRVDDGSWNRVSSANYRFEDTTLTVYLDDATGGVQAGQTVDVRATGRKIDVRNGAVTVTDPTAPGEKLDTQLQIDSRSEGFHVNVGPTDDGDRVHYAYADGFPTEDYVVIDSAGNQQLHLPNAVQGDRFRVSHLETRVVAETGDVRIDVVEAGENPELDVSPGPGGPGDTVTVEYYNTESGVTYLLNSLTRSIVIDSDTAQSPAIFQADDSDETWTILRDSGATGSSSSGGGAVGQFQRQAADTVGSLSLPISGSGLGQLALLGVLGLGGVLVLRRLFGDDDMAEDTATASGASGSGDSGLVDRVTGLVGSLGSVGGRAARGAGSGLVAGLQRVLDFVGRVVEVILGNRRASIAAAVVAAIVAARVGLVQLPQGTGILIVVSGVPLATWLIMRRSGAVSRSVWLASTVAAVILGLEFVAPGTVQTAIEQLTSEDVAPLLILVGAGAAYLWYRSRQSDRPQIIIGGDDE